jgi:hypothetical protein
MGVDKIERVIQLLNKVHVYILGYTNRWTI